MRKVSIAVIGGSGFWSNKAHHKHINLLRSSYDVSVVAIIDFEDPKSMTKHKELQAVLEEDKPKWLNPGDYNNCDQVIEELQNKLGVNLVIIASNPVTHFDYGMSCIKRGINVICDKPIVSHLNASTDVKSAEQIKKNYDTMLAAYQDAKKTNPSLLFHSILRRRSLDAFSKVASELNAVYKKTGSGINNATFLVNGGKYKLPAELSGTGAHGYADGVGSISHSAYHYIDLLSWYLQSAPGKITSVRPQLNTVFRIEDYLKAKSYEPLTDLIKVDPKGHMLPDVSKSMAGAELNSSFTFHLYRGEQKVGSVDFIFNLLSFSPRTLGYSPEIDEPADMPGGGRTSHIIINVNQDGLQNWELIKNDLVFGDYTITLTGRRHPHIEGKDFEKITYGNAYEETTISLKDMLEEVIASVAEDKPLDDHPVIRDLSQEALATSLYASCYQLLANDYVGNYTFRPNNVPIV